MEKYTNRYIICTLLACCISATFFYLLYGSKYRKPQFITDKLGLTSIKIKKIITPNSIEELQNIIRNTNEPISIAGGRYCQGGQMAYPNGIVINMKKLNAIINLDNENKTITVQAGATWHKIQHYIDSYNLSITAMQSYNNFTLGGSLSVNAHGRDIQYCQLINTVQSIQIVLADGSLVNADRSNNSDLFNAAIGGYGLLGVITQATLKLTENIPLKRKVQPCNLTDFNKLFFNTVTSDPSTVFYNTDIYPNQYQTCLITTWHKTKQSLTSTTRLQSHDSPFYIIDRALEFFTRRMPLAKSLRLVAEKIQKIAPQIVWRNHEMSYSVHQLAIHTHFPTTMTLQEYFIPIDQAYTFAKKLRSILKKNWVNVLNVSIRYVTADTTSIMSYAPQDSFAFVLYLNIVNAQKNITNSCKWTQKIIDAALKNNGTFYLPYIMCATQNQFDQAYPQFKSLLAIKHIYDPTNKFQNMLLKKYGTSM